MLDGVRGEVRLGRPEIRDGVACWELATATRVLDVNSRYAYLLWFRDFAATSVVARCADGDDDAVVGFVTGYRRPDAPDVLVVWQVAVQERVRGRGVAGAMLDHLFSAVPDVHHLETTITPGNEGSAALFAAFAARHGALLRRRELFGTDLLGVDHEPEFLYRIGPPAHRSASGRERGDE